LAIYSAAISAPFSATERFISNTRKGEYNGDHRENQERVEIGKRCGLLFAKILERL
jgi:hypothetical protein